MEESSAFARKLLALRDDLTETSHCCSFLLEAYATLALEEEAFRQDVALGGAHLASHVQGKLLQVINDLHELHDSLNDPRSPPKGA